MKFLSAILLVFLSTCLKSEVHIVFNLQHCLEGSTHIFQGKVVSTDGILKIDKIIKGDDKPATLKIDGFENLVDYVGYAPKEIKGWELLIFLDKSEKGEWRPINISDNPEDRDFELVLSILWIKDGEYYSGIESPDYYGPVVFGNWVATKQFEAYIYEYVQLQKEIKNIKQLKSCRKKMNSLVELYDSTEIKELVYQGMKEVKCDKKLERFIEELLQKGKYDGLQRTAIRDYVISGKAKMVNKIFTTEFNFWRSCTAENKEAKWWDYKEPYGKRFFYFKALVNAIAGNKKEGWREKCEEVFAFFSQLPNYNASDKNEKFHEALQRCYLN